ncbi:MAG: carboxypeptidase regulatory-like domain-containing protein, partial [Bryobacteraceae bacterium]
QTPSAAPATVEGRVVSTSGEPLRKAELTLRTMGERGAAAGGYRATADNSGNFAFRAVAPGRYMLISERPGYVRQVFGARQGVRGGPPIELVPGQQMTDLVIKMIPHAVVTGKVTDSDGDPVLRASVQALRTRYFRGKRQLMPVGRAEANDLGEYRIFGLSPGKYYFSVSVPQYNFRGPQRSSGGRESGYAATFYPGVADPAQAGAIELSAGTELRGIDFRLSQTPTVRITGRVIDGITNQPAQNVSVMLLPRDGASFGFNRNIGMARGPEATFELAGVAPGSYLLAANRMIQGSRSRATVQQPIEVGTGDIEGVVLALMPPVQLSGIIKVEGQNTASPEGVGVILESEHGPMFNSPSGTVKTGSNFIIEGVGAGSYKVNVFDRTRTLYLKSVRFGERDVTGSVINIAAGAAPGHLEITMSADGGQLTGAVLDGSEQPASGITVVLAPSAGQRDRHWLFKTAVTDQNGGFAIQAIAPGDYTAFAFDALEEGMQLDPEFLMKHQANGTSVEIEERGLENLQLRVIPNE